MLQFNGYQQYNAINFEELNFITSSVSVSNFASIDGMGTGTKEIMFHRVFSIANKFDILTR